MSPLIKLVIFVYALDFFHTTTAYINPYCDVNETIITYRPVWKTRQVVQYPRGPFKMFKKPKVTVESYEDKEKQVRVKLVPGCCEGFKMSEFKICTPICEKICPKNSFCSEPNLCECKKGYVSAISPVDGTHICEPICDPKCPDNGVCVAPNTCECERGFHANGQHCVPRCTSECPFEGVCVSPELCECKLGYRAEAGTCIPNGCLNNEECVCIERYRNETVSGTCEPCVSEECDADLNDVMGERTAKEVTRFSDHELDDNEIIYLTTMKTDDEGTENVSETNCPEDYKYYNGECRPKYFVSDEANCKYKGCTENAICQEDGTCDCIEGFLWYNMSVPHQISSPTERYNPTTDRDTTESTNTEEPIESTESWVSVTEYDVGAIREFSVTTHSTTLQRNVKAICISLKEYRNLMLKPEYEGTGFEADFAVTLSMILGIIIMLVALIFLALIVLRNRRKGSMGVNGNNLNCHYKKKRLEAGDDEREFSMSI